MTSGPLPLKTAVDQGFRAENGDDLYAGAIQAREVRDVGDAEGRRKFPDAHDRLFGWHRSISVETT
jgi:hypothetical protein